MRVKILAGFKICISVPLNKCKKKTLKTATSNKRNKKNLNTATLSKRNKRTTKKENEDVATLIKDKKISKNT